MEKLIPRRQISSAADLLALLTDIQSQGFDLSVMWVRHNLDTKSDAIGADVTQFRLTDGSKVVDLMLYVGDQPWN